MTYYTTDPNNASNLMQVPKRRTMWGSVFQVSPLVQVGVTVVLVVAASLAAAYCVMHGAGKRPASGTNIDWILHGLVCSVLVIGVLGAFFPSVLPLKAAGEPQNNMDLETFAVGSSMGQLLNAMSTENLIQRDTIDNAVELIRDTGSFALESTGTVPPPNVVVDENGDVLNEVLVQAQQQQQQQQPSATSSDATSKTSSGSSGDADGDGNSSTPDSKTVPLDIPLIRVNEQLRSAAGMQQATLRSGNTSSSPTYVFRVWVTLDMSKQLAASTRTTNGQRVSDSPSSTALDMLQDTTHPFLLRCTTTADSADASTPLHVPFRVLSEPDTIQRQSGPYRWYHLESAPVTFPASTHSVFWRIDDTNAALSTRYWWGFEAFRYRTGGASQYVRPGDSLQAMFSTYLTANPFTNGGRTWLDLSGNGYTSTFSNGSAEIQADGGVKQGADTVITGPPTWVLLGQSAAATSDANNVTPFTFSFMYSPPPAPDQDDEDADDDDVNAEEESDSRLTQKARKADFKTLVTLYATYTNLSQLDNPPNYFFRVQVNAKTRQLRVVQQVIKDTTNDTRTSERCMYIPLRNSTSKDPVLYTLTMRPSSSERHMGDLTVYANGQQEVAKKAWLDLHYDLNATGTSGKIVWGDLRRRHQKTSTKSASAQASTGSLYAFLVFSRFFSEDDVHQLHASLFTMYYATANGQLTPHSGDGHAQSTCPRSWRNGSFGPTSSSESYAYITPSVHALAPAPASGSADVVEHEYASLFTQTLAPDSTSASLASTVLYEDAGKSDTQQVTSSGTSAVASAEHDACPAEESSCGLYAAADVSSDAGTHTAATSARSTALGPRYTRRSEYTDVEYQMLSATEKQNVLQDEAFLRTPRRFDEVSTTERADLTWSQEEPPFR